MLGCDINERFRALATKANQPIQRLHLEEICGGKESLESGRRKKPRKAGRVSVCGETSEGPFAERRAR